MGDKVQPASTRVIPGCEKGREREGETKKRTLIIDRVAVNVEGSVRVTHEFVARACEREGGGDTRRRRRRKAEREKEKGSIGG